MVGNGAPTKERAVIQKYRFTAAAYADADALYLSGNLPKLGEWNPANALPMRRLKSGAYRFSRSLPVGTEVEFKLLRTTDWSGVEKGAYGEEIGNHTVTLTANKLCPVVITHFANDN
jgi:hypothetical protein